MICIGLVNETALWSFKNNIALMDETKQKDNFTVSRLICIKNLQTGVVKEVEQLQVIGWARQRCA